MELDKIEIEEEIVVYNDKMRDCFGLVFKEVKFFFDGLRFCWIVKEFGFE